MTITAEQLAKIFPLAKSRVAIFAPFLNAAMEEFGIDTPIRQAGFLAQVGHESGQLRYTAEIASGAAYENRLDLGNTSPGDGKKYKGRGLIQLTGKFNYTQLMMSLDLDCLDHPELLETPDNACRSAAWWWSVRGLNTLADRGDFKKITKIINGGYNGLDDRQKLYEVACRVLGV